MNENTPFDPLTDLAQNTNTSTRAGVPLRPRDVKLINLRHNGQNLTDSLSMQIPNNDENDPKSRPETVPVKKGYVFIPLFETTVVMGNSIQSNPSFAGFYDVYRYNNRQSTSLGLYNGNADATRKYFKQEQLGVNHRIFGTLISVDGVPVKQIDKLKPYINEQGMLLCYMQLNPGKYRTMQQVDLHTNYNSKDYAGHLVSVDVDEANMSDAEHTVNTQNGTTYRPHFSMKALTDEQKKRFSEALSPITEKVLRPYVREIKNFDNYLNQLLAKLPLRNHGIDVVNNLASHSISDIDTLNDYINDQTSTAQAWNNINTFATQAVETPVAPAPQPASDITNSANNADANKNADNGNTIEDDELPF